MRLRADKVILPGVGSFGDAMAHLKKYELDRAIREVVAEKNPFLGICLGLQLLFEASQETEGVEGLGILKGQCLRIPETEGLKIPLSGGILWIFHQREDSFPVFQRGLMFILFTLIILKQMHLLFLLQLFMAKKFRLLFKRIIFSLYSSTQKKVEMWAYRF